MAAGAFGELFPIRYDDGKRGGSVVHPAHCRGSSGQSKGTSPHLSGTAPDLDLRVLRALPACFTAF